MPAEALPRKRSFKDVIRNFAPSWFSVIMGTGSISLLFNVFPYGNDTQPMKALSLAVLLLNLVLFLLFLGISIARYSLFPDIWSIMIKHPVQSLFTGTMPMGAVTIINAAITIVLEGYGIGGRSLLYICWGLWWFDVLLSAACAWGMIYTMSTSQSHSLEKMTAVWLLPVVTLIVASSCGGVLAQALETYNPRHALVSATVSIALVSIGLSLAFTILTVYVLRLIVYGLPPGGSILSVFLPLGPTGQAGIAFMVNGDYYSKAFPLSGGTSAFLKDPMTGMILNVLCTSLAFALWSLASMYLIFAVLGMQNGLRRTKLSFSVPVWGMVFPNGVYANHTIALGRKFDSSFFRIWGAIYACITLLLWLSVTYPTLVSARARTIFHAPCLEDVNLAQMSTAAEAERNNKTT